MQPITGLGAPWTGTLQLTMNPDGIIQGYYRSGDNFGALIPVTGGRTGDSVWMDIGTMGRLRVSGTLRDGVITGTAIDARTNEPYGFTARISG